MILMVKWFLFYYQNEGFRLFNIVCAFLVASGC